MVGNLGKVQARLNDYVAMPRKYFKMASGMGPRADGIKEKVTQYWADKDIANSKKLQGFTLDLKGFDPRNTSNRELRQIGQALAKLGIIDEDLVFTLSGIDVEFDRQGNEISLDKKVNAYAYFDKSLKFLGELITEGNDFAHDALVELKTTLSVMLALDEYARTPKRKSLVNIRV